MLILAISFISGIIHLADTHSETCSVNEKTSQSKTFPNESKKELDRQKLDKLLNKLKKVLDRQKLDKLLKKLKKVLDRQKLDKLLNKLKKVLDRQKLDK